MTDPDMPCLRQALPADWDKVRHLLTKSELPVEDLGPDRLGNFLVAVDGENIVGLIGLEIFGTTGLLRSLVVAADARRAGLGAELVCSLESVARSAGIEELWLLTIDAGQFFQRQGFTVVDREVVPDSIRETDEFSDLCPATAFLMKKSIAR